MSEAPKGGEAGAARESEEKGGRRRAPAAQNRGARSRHALFELTAARLREFVREPEVLFWVFLFPVLLAFALGIAFRESGPERLRVAVEQSAPGDPRASALASALARSEGVEPVTLAPDEAARALRGGRVALVVRATDDGEAGAAKNAGAGAVEMNRAGDTPANAATPPTDAAGAAPPSVEYRYDPTRPESRQARLAADDALQRARGRADVLAARDERVTEPGARYIDFLIPGLVGMNLMGSGLWGVGFAIVMARSRQLLKRLAATPMRRSHYLLSFVLSRFLFLVPEVGVVILFARYVFDFTVRGSYAEMSLLLALGGLSFSGLGLLVAARPRTIEGVSGLMNFVMLPMWLLSGTFFSSERFPDFLRPFIKALPLTALNDGLRAVMNDGATLASVWPEASILAAWCAVSFVAALKLFRWQ